MCAVSVMGDYWRHNDYPKWEPIVKPLLAPHYFPPGEVSKFEFDKLKQEMEILKKLLEGAKTYDKVTGQPNCEMEDKIVLIKKVAELVGVDMKDVFDAQ